MLLFHFECSTPHCAPQEKPIVHFQSFTLVFAAFSFQSFRFAAPTVLSFFMRLGFACLFWEIFFLHFLTVETSVKQLCEAEQSRGNPTHIGTFHPLLHISTLSLLSCAQMCEFCVQWGFPFSASMCVPFHDRVCFYVCAKEAEWKDSLP